MIDMLAMINESKLQALMKMGALKERPFLFMHSVVREQKAHPGRMVSPDKRSS